MFIEIIVVLLAGIVFGIFTGLIPGIHTNLIAILLLVNSTYFFEFFSLEQFIILIISMSITHTFISFIPSLFLGIPDSDTALSLLPGHRLVLEGKALTALYVSALGSLGGMTFALLFSPLFYFSLEWIFTSLKPLIPYFLLLVLSLLVLFEENNTKRFWALIIIFFSASLGLLSLNSFHLKNSLLVIFTGLFGISGIIMSLFSEQAILSKQEKNQEYKVSRKTLQSLSVGGFSASLCAIFPGLGNAQAGTIGALFYKKLEAKEFIIILSSITTVNFVIGFLTFFLLEKTRNGSVFVIAQLTTISNINQIIMYYGIMLITSIISFFLMLWLGKKALKYIQRVNFKLLNWIILVFLVTLVSYLSGSFGLLILISSAALGILCMNLEVRRVHLMSILLVPIILNLI